MLQRLSQQKVPTNNTESETTAAGEDPVNEVAKAADKAIAEAISTQPTRAAAEAKKSAIASIKAEKTLSNALSLEFTTTQKIIAQRNAEQAVRQANQEAKLRIAAVDAAKRAGKGAAEIAEKIAKADAAIAAANTANATAKETEKYALQYELLSIATKTIKRNNNLKKFLESIESAPK